MSLPSPMMAMRTIPSRILPDASWRSWGKGCDDERYSRYPDALCALARHRGIGLRGRGACPVRLRHRRDRGAPRPFPRRRNQRIAGNRGPSHPFFLQFPSCRFPVKAALIAVLCNFVLNIAFVVYLVKTDFNGAHIGLAVATSLSAYVNFFFLFKNAVKTKIFNMDQDIILYILKSVIATIVMSAFLLYFDLSKQAWMDYELVERVMNLFLLIIFSALIYFAFLYLFNIKPKNIKEQL